MATQWRKGRWARNPMGPTGSSSRYPARISSLRSLSQDGLSEVARHRARTTLHSRATDFIIKPTGRMPRLCQAKAQRRAWPRFKDAKAGTSAR